MGARWGGNAAEQVEREPPVIAGRVPPHDLDAEAAVLSAIMLDPDKLGLVRHVLEPERFYSEANRLVYRELVWLADRNMPIDVVSLRHRLDEVEQLKAVGGLSYLSQIVDATPAVANAEHHARIVYDCWRVRRMIAIAQRIAAEGYSVGHSEAASYLEQGQADVFATAQDTEHSPIVAMDEAVAEFQALQLAAADQPGVALSGLSTGYADLDRKFRMRLGDQSVIAGRPGMGKSALALNIALNVAQQNPTDIGEELPSAVAVFSLEMPRIQCVCRMLCVEAGTDVAKTLASELTKPDVDRIFAAARVVAPLPIWVDDTAAISVSQLRAKVRVVQQRALARGFELRLVVIDYLQLMRGLQGVNRERQLAEISAGGKQLAKDTSTHVLALSQLNRGVEHRSPPRPNLSDLRESGAIEQDADAVVFVYRPEYYADKRKDLKLDASDKGTAQLIIGKQRNGPTGTIRLVYHDTCTRFDSLHYYDKGDSRPPPDRDYHDTDDGE